MLKPLIINLKDLRFRVWSVILEILLKSYLVRVGYSHNYPCISSTFKPLSQHSSHYPVIQPDPCTSIKVYWHRNHHSFTFFCTYCLHNFSKYSIQFLSVPKINKIGFLSPDFGNFLKFVLRLRSTVESSLRNYLSLIPIVIGWNSLTIDKSFLHRKGDPSTISDRGPKCFVSNPTHQTLPPQSYMSVPTYRLRGGGTVCFDRFTGRDFPHYPLRSSSGNVIRIRSSLLQDLVRQCTSFLLFCLNYFSHLEPERTYNLTLLLFPRM